MSVPLKMPRPGVLSEPRWQVLMALAFARVAMGFQFQSVAATAPLLAADLHMSQAQIGWLIGLYLLPGVVIALPGGLLGARFGDKRMVMLALACMGIGGLGMAFASTVEMAYAARLVSGVGGVVFNVLLTKMVADWFAGREIVLAMSILVNSWPVGIGLALLALTPLAQAASWQLAFVTTAIFCVVGWACVAWGYQPAPGAAPVRLARLPAREGWLVFVAGFPWLLFNACYALLVAFVPVYLIAKGAPLTLASTLTAVNTLLLIVSIQMGGVMVQRWRRPTLIASIGAIGWALSLLGLLLSDFEPLIWLILAGLFSGMPAGILVALPSEILSPASRGSGMGVFYTVYYVGMALFPPLAGWLADRYAAASVPIWLALACLLGSVLMLAITRSLQRIMPAPSGATTATTATTPSAPPRGR